MNISIIDDQQLFAEAVADFLSGNDYINQVKTYKSVRKFLDEYDTEITDIIIIEMNMVEINGIDFLSEMKKINPSSRIIVLSAEAEANTIRFAASKGAHGYLGKDASSAELIAAILAVQHGELYIDESLRISLMQNRQQGAKYTSHLSAREKEVLQHVCGGKTIKETSVEMQLSVHTVKTYYKNILKKFKLKRTADLIVYAIKNRIYKPESSKFL